MKIRNAPAISVAVVCLGLSAAMYAAPVSVRSPVHAMFAKTKLVKLSLRNDSASQIELKVGDDVMTLEAGKTIALKLPVGTRILINANTPMHAAGALLEKVSNDLNDVTIGIE